MRNYFLLILFLLSINFHAYSQADSSQVNPYRLGVVLASGASVLGGSYIYVQNSWWSEQSTAFHFDDGTDLRYAKNIDKGGHFFGGVLVADFFHSNLKWAGLNEKKSYWYGAAMGSFIQLAIEMKDAYAPYWGFSVWDFGTGSLGALVPVAERYWKPMKYIDFKMSYYKRSNRYWDLGREQKPWAPPHPHAYQDDYVNQTYWMTVYPLKDRNIDIGIAIGFGLDDTQYLTPGKTKVGGNNEIYIALDYDLKRVLKRWDTPTAKKVKHWLNYIKVPAPTIIISPETKFYPIFF